MRLGNTVGGGNWASLPEGPAVLAVFEAGPADPSPKYPNTPRVYLKYEVPEDWRENLDLDEVPDGLDQSYRVQERMGATLGNSSRRSRLYERVKDFVGAQFAGTLDKWLAAGGEFEINWLIGCRIKANIDHTIDADSPERVWANIGGVVADREHKNLLASNLAIIKTAMAKDDPRRFKLIIGDDMPKPAPVVAAPRAKAGATAVADPPEEPADEEVF